MVAGQWDLKPNSKCCAGQHGDDGLASLFGFEIHACQFNFTQDLVNFHNHLETALRGIFWVHVLCLSDHRQIHASGKIRLSGGDDHPFDHGISEAPIDQSIEIGKTLLAHDIHWPGLAVPGDGGQTIGIKGLGEIGHISCL